MLTDAMWCRLYADRRHRIPKRRYKVTNWPAYDRAHQQRGSLTVWGDAQE